MLSVLFFKEASWRVFFACIFFIFKEMHVLCCFWQDPETYQWYVQASADYFQVTFEEAESMVGRAPPNPMQRALNIDSRGFLPKRLGEFLMEKNWGNIFLGAGSCWVVGGCFFATIFWFISANLFFCSNSGSWNLNLRRIFHCCRYSKHEFDLLKVQKQKASAQTKHDIIVIKKTLLESQQFFQSIKNIYEEIQVWKDDFFEMFPNQKIPGFFKTFLASEFRNAGGVFRNHRGFAGGGVGFAKCIHWKLFEICGNLENFWIYIYIYISDISDIFHLDVLSSFFFHVPKTFWECKSQEHKDWNSNRHGHHHGHIMIFAYFRQRCVPDVSLRCYGVADSTSPGCINAWVFFTTCHSGTVRVFVLSNKHTEKVGNLKQNKVAWTSPQKNPGWPGMCLLCDCRGWLILPQVKHQWLWLCFEMKLWKNGNVWLCCRHDTKTSFQKFPNEMFSHFFGGEDKVTKKQTVT